MAEANKPNGIVGVFAEEDLKVNSILGYPLAYSELSHAVNSDGTPFHLYTLGPPSQYLPYELSEEELKKKEALESLFPVIFFEDSGPTDFNEFVDQLWESCPSIENAGFDPSKFRVDCYGNVMFRDADYGSPLSWGIDHWFPRSRGGLTVSPNLRIINSRAAFLKGERLEFCVPHWELQAGISVEYFLSVFSSANHEFRGRALTFFFKGGELSLFLEDGPSVPNMYNFPPEWKERRKKVGKAVAAMESKHLQRNKQEPLRKDISFHFDDEEPPDDAQVSNLDKEDSKPNSNSNASPNLHWNTEDWAWNVEDGDVDALDTLISALDDEISRKEKLKIELLLKRSVWMKKKSKAEEKQKENIHVQPIIANGTALHTISDTDNEDGGGEEEILRWDENLHDENSQEVINDLLQEDEEGTPDLHVKISDERNAEEEHEGEEKGGANDNFENEQAEDRDDFAHPSQENGGNNSDFGNALEAALSRFHHEDGSSIYSETSDHYAAYEESNEESGKNNHKLEMMEEELNNDAISESLGSPNGSVHIHSHSEFDKDEYEDVEASDHSDIRNRFLSNSKHSASTTPPISPTFLGMDATFNDVDHRNINFKEVSEGASAEPTFVEDKVDKDESQVFENESKKVNALNEEDKTRWRSSIPSPSFSPSNSPKMSSLQNQKPSLSSTEPQTIPPPSSHTLAVKPDVKAMDSETLVAPNAKDMKDVKNMNESIFMDMVNVSPTMASFASHTLSKMARKNQPLFVKPQQNLSQIQTQLNQNHNQNRSKILEKLSTQRAESNQSQIQNNLDLMMYGIMKIRNANVSKSKASISTNLPPPKSPPQHKPGQTKSGAGFTLESRQRNLSFSERPLHNNTRLITRSTHSSPDILNGKRIGEARVDQNTPRGQLDIRFTTSESSSNDSGDNDSVSEGGNSAREAAVMEGHMQKRFPHHANYTAPSRSKFLEETSDVPLPKMTADLEWRKNFQKWKSQQTSKIASSPPNPQSTPPHSSAPQSTNPPLPLPKTLPKHSDASAHSLIKNIMDKNDKREFIASLDEGELNSDPEILLVRPLKFFNSVKHEGTVSGQSNPKPHEPIPSVGSDSNLSNHSDAISHGDGIRKQGQLQGYEHNSTVNQSPSGALAKSFYKQAFQPM